MVSQLRIWAVLWLSLLLVGFGAAVQGGVIPVVVDRVLPDHRPQAAVKFGVPFPIDTFKVDDAIQVLDDRDQVQPHQALVTATWDPSGARGVRWLLVDFLTDAGRTYRIVYGADLKPAAAPAIAPVAKLVGERIELDTRWLGGAIDVGKADLFSGLKAMDQPIVEPGNERFSGFYVEHETRGIFRADLDPKPSVVLEEAGPIRATIKMDGWYTNAAGEQFCRFSIRAHFFRERPDVKLEHTFIYTGKSKEDRIKSMGVQLPQKTGQRGHIWGEGDERNDMLEIFTSSAKVVLDSPNHDEIELLRYTPDGVRRLAGRANAAFNYGAVSVAIRDGWQQYPLGFEVNDGLMQVQLWPSGERMLDTTFDGYWWFLSEHQKRFMLMTKRKAAGKTSDEMINRYREVVNATGAAKTHEVWLSFAAPRELGAGHYGGRLWREVQNPVIALADPAWSTATRALDFCLHTPRNDELFADEERYHDAVYTMVQQITERRHWYGWWDWGGYYQSPGEEPGAWRNTGGQNIWNRKWPKSHYGWGQLPWLSYFRSGDRRWLRYAQTYTLYSADRAFVHHTDKSVNRFAGYEYHYDNSDIHWVGGYGGAPANAEHTNNLQDKVDYVYMYWLTGDRRALDVLNMWGNNLSGDRFGSEFTWKIGLEKGGDIRNGGMQLQRTTMLYQATWNPKFLKVATHIANSFAGIQSEADLIAAEGDKTTANGDDVWRFHSACGWAYEGLWLYYNVTGDERIKKTLLTFIERSTNFDGSIGWGYGPMRAYSYGYELTGDELYLDMIRAELDDWMSRWVTPSAWSTVTQKWATLTMGRSLGTLASAPEAWRKRNLPTHVCGRTLRYEYFRDYDAAANAYFHEAQDRAWKFRVLFNRGGSFVLTGPDGKVVQTTPMVDFPFNRKWVEVEVKPDGQTGTYTLTCVKAAPWTSIMGEDARVAQARIIRCDLPVVVGINGALPAKRAAWDMPLPVRGRSLFFKPTQSPAVVHVAPNTGRSVVLSHQGQVIAASAGQAPDYIGAHRMALSDEWIGKVLELQVDRRPDRFFFRTMHDSGPITLLWFEGIPPYVAANPEDWFAPAP
jgi:hypothetical protein